MVSKMADRNSPSGDTSLDEQTSGNDWWEKPLSQLSRDEWENLCDGCGRCCLHKLIDDDTDELHYTRVACELLDVTTGHCGDYPNRKTKVPECLVLTLEASEAFDWLPNSCAYRLRAQNLPLPSWHPLISGDKESVKQAGISVADRVISAKDCAPEHYEDEVIHWVDVSASMDSSR